MQSFITTAAEPCTPPAPSAPAARINFEEDGERWGVRGWFYMPVLCHLVTMVTLVRGTDRALLCVSARVEAPPSRALQDQSAALWWKTVPLSDVPAFRRRKRARGWSLRSTSTIRLPRFRPAGVRFHVSVDSSVDGWDKRFGLFL